MGCKSLDEQVARRDPKVADLLDQFVCVRVIQANGMDLSLFQFDYDLTWAVFFLNADRTIYGRYGSRTQKEGGNDITLEGFAKAMAGALTLHQAYPANKAGLAGKTGPAPKYATPEQYPSLKGRFRATLAENEKVRQSCMHCHMIHNARRDIVRSAKQTLADELLWPYPRPDALGLKLDPTEKATVVGVADGSAAAKADFLKGDEIVRLNGQPIISIADVQWVLEHGRAGDELKAEVKRGGETRVLTIPLRPGWRRGDFSWRTSTWDLRRMALGGLVCEDLPAGERQRLGLADDALALRVKHVGQFGNHAVAKNAGFQKEDVVIEFGGDARRLSESALIAQVLQTRPAGEKVSVTVLRGGKRVPLRLPLQ